MRLANLDGRATILVGDTAFDVNEASGGRIAAQPRLAIAGHLDELHRLVEQGAISGGVTYDDAQLGPPIPDPPSIIAIGLNYWGHAQETGQEPTDPPAVFTKFRSSLNRPYGDVVLPADETTADYEAELAFVIGRGGKRIPAERAWDHIAGLCIAQDISERRVQRAAGGQFSLGKSYDTFFPLGPAIVSIDEMANPDDLAIECIFNGETVQSARTSDLIVGIPKLVELLSAVTTLSPGDVVSTGTPAGVGVAKDPQVFLRPGDVIETRIEGLGHLRNTCVAEQR